MKTYILNDEGITFFYDGIITLNVPLARIVHDPKMAIEVFKILDQGIKEQQELINKLKGDLNNAGIFN